MYLSDFVPKNKHLFKAVISDPISGDNRKPYINPEIILYWPQLLSFSDIAFPNLTELTFFSGIDIQNESTDEHFAAFSKRFPNLDFIITSYQQSYEKMGIYLNFKDTKQFIRHEFYDAKLDGAGDVFSSYFLKNYLLQELSPIVSCKKAIGQTLKLVQNAISDDIDELTIH
jgi:pyridoxal/pyridoxine/pyridoxamine kinase